MKMLWSSEPATIHLPLRSVTQNAPNRQCLRFLWPARQAGLRAPALCSGARLLCQGQSSRTRSSAFAAAADEATSAIEHLQ